MSALRSCFARTEAWLQAGKYVSALVSEVPRRNGWTIAEHAGDRSPDRTQRLLNRGQARPYTAILRHIVLVMAALAICAVTAAQLKDRTDAQASPPATPAQPPPGAGMIPLTVPEIKRLLAAALNRPRSRGHTVHWLTWRRRHQARSRWFHQRTRLNREYALVS